MVSGSLKGLFADELESLLSIESQVAKAFPKLQKNVFTAELADAIKDQTTKTKGNVAGLRSALRLLKRKSDTPLEPTVTAILASCSQAQATYAKGNLRDAALLAVLQRLERYRAAAYQSTFALAKQMGEQQILDLLNEGATQDDLAAKRFEQIAIQVNAEAFMDTHSERCAPTIKDLTTT